MGGKALGWIWMHGTWIWMPGAPGARWANLPSEKYFFFHRHQRFSNKIILFNKENFHSKKFFLPKRLLLEKVFCSNFFLEKHLLLCSIPRVPRLSKVCAPCVSQKRPPCFPTTAVPHPL